MYGIYERLFSVYELSMTARHAAVTNMIRVLNRAWNLRLDKDDMRDRACAESLALQLSCAFMEDGSMVDVERLLDASRRRTTGE